MSIEPTIAGAAFAGLMIGVLIALYRVDIGESTMFEFQPIDKEMTYADIRPRLQTGDVILFSGNSLFSKLIKIVTRSQWSHAGMVVKRGDSVFVWESDIKGVSERDFVTEYRLSEKVAMTQATGCKLCIRLLSGSRSPDMLEAYETFRKSHEGKPFERDKIELVKAALGIDLTEEDLSSLFCSELVAATWKHMGLLPPNVDSNWYAPKDFSTHGIVDELIVRGILSPEILVVTGR